MQHESLDSCESHVRLSTEDQREAQAAARRVIGQSGYTYAQLVQAVQANADGEDYDADAYIAFRDAELAAVSAATRLWVETPDSLSLRLVP